MKLKEIEILKKLDLGDLEEKREKARLEGERLEKEIELAKAKEIEEHKKIMEEELKKQKEELDKIKEEFNKDIIGNIEFGIIGQFHIKHIKQLDYSDNYILHIQIKTSLKLKEGEENRDYGLAFNLEVSKIEGELINKYYLSQKGSYKESLATPKSFTYLPIYIYKGLKEVSYLKIGEIIIKREEKRLYEILRELENPSIEELYKELKGEDND